MEVDSDSVAGKRGREASANGDNEAGGSSQGGPGGLKGNPGVKKKKGNTASQGSHGGAESCTVCCMPTTDNDKISCAICVMTYHAGCCGWGFCPSPTEVKLLSLTGWVCAVCVDGAKAAFNKMQASQSETSKRLLELHARVSMLERKANDENLPQPSRGSAGAVLSEPTARGGRDVHSGGGGGDLHLFPPLGTGLSGGANGGEGGDMNGVTGGVGDGGGVWMTQGRRGPMAATFAEALRFDANSAPINLTSLVEKTITNINKKKANVVVSGLKETGSEASDTDLFMRLCVEFLTYKPRVIKSTRLGKPSKSTNQRLLLVTLGSGEEVNAVMAEARLLRDADNEYVSRHIFINRDLTKEEAKASYEKREARRAKTAAAVAVSSAAAVAAAASAIASSAASSSAAVSFAASPPSVASTAVNTGTEAQALVVPDTSAAVLPIPGSQLAVPSNKPASPSRTTMLSSHVQSSPSLYGSLPGAAAASDLCPLNPTGRGASGSSDTTKDDSSMFRRGPSLWSEEGEHFRGGV